KKKVLRNFPMMYQSSFFNIPGAKVSFRVMMCSDSETLP
ncbi:MAG: hypothetical protein ACJA0J_000356, partial [Bdellovibrionota bacterium]